jgi:hypothetical protein
MKVEKRSEMIVPFNHYLQIIIQMFIKMDEIRRAGKRLLCESCSYSWVFTGVTRYFAVCPKCHKEVDTRPPKKEKSN